MLWRIHRSDPLATPLSATDRKGEVMIVSRDTIEQFRADFMAREVNEPAKRQFNTMCDMALQAAPEHEREVDSFGHDLREQNLAMMMRRIAARLKSLDHGTSLAGQALELLERMGLQGSLLRAPEPPTATEHYAGAEAVGIITRSPLLAVEWADVTQAIKLSIGTKLYTQPTHGEQERVIELCANRAYDAACNHADARVIRNFVLALKSALATTKQPDAEGWPAEKWLGNCACADCGEKCWQNRLGPLCTQDTTDSLLAALPAVPEKKS